MGITKCDDGISANVFADVKFLNLLQFVLECEGMRRRDYIEY